MEAKHPDMEERIWNYIDGTATIEERNVIEQLIREHAAWKAKYHEFVELSQLLQSSELEHPSLRFTRNVMEEIARAHIAPATKTYINKRIIWGIGIFFITLLVSFLTYGIAQINWSSSGSSSVSDYLGKIDYGKFFNNTYLNAFMMVNVVLGLFLLDRYLANKRKQFREDI